ncbi:MAG: DUF885 domain-containing protein [Pseudoxanthomonas suwonensis]|nr:DUF885 domain-containing protein [Pseudoxanthomonas suwonensis]
MRRSLPRYVLLLCFVLSSGVLQAQTVDPAETRKLHAFFDAQWERGLRESPERASLNGDRRFNDRWSDLDLDAIAARHQATRDALAELGTIRREALSSEDRLNYDVMQWQLERSIQRHRFGQHLLPVSHRGGPQTMGQIAASLQFNSARDYRDWLARMRAVPQRLEQVTALMREGMASGHVPPRVLMQRVPPQIAMQIVEDAQSSQFYLPFRRFPDTIPAIERTALQAEAKQVIVDAIVPAYRRFAAFFDEQYLPVTRDSIAATDLPDGKAWYDFLAETFTTTDLTAEQIHQIGLREVARIRGEMEKIREEVGFQGDLAAFFEHLRTDPKFFYKTPEALMEAYLAISKRIDPETVKIARTIPRMPYGVRPIPDNIAPDTTTAYYQGPALDGSRAGFYYVNLYRPEVRPTWEMMALSLHEAVPGHHFQIARAQELGELPKFRRSGGFTAYIEGWGLYAERLGYDMGLYEDPYDRMGQHAYDMWRAVRLVVDTGMHAKGWSRQQAIDYFLENAPKTEADITNEIDRYIGNPGQALAYKIGQLKISELRERAEQALGADFDIRDFNDAVLETGAVPLQVLEAHIDGWIAARQDR